MAVNWLLVGGHQLQQREEILETRALQPEIITECYCPNGHSILSEAGVFQGHPGLTLRLRGRAGEGLLVISPVLGDRSRSFLDFERVPGEIVEISCPTCSEPFPVYNVCDCGAQLVALFTSPQARFSKCVGICQRIGCLHAELLSERDLRLYSRRGYY